jgi:hypothetical protein
VVCWFVGHFFARLLRGAANAGRWAVLMARGSCAHGAGWAETLRIAQTGCAGDLDGRSTWAMGRWLCLSDPADEQIVEAERSGLAAGRRWSGVGLTRALASPYGSAFEQESAA